MKFLTLLFGLTFVAPALAHKVIGIADGDTLTLLIDAKTLKVRLANIDAPEKAQAFGERSKQSLSDLCFGKDASYKEQDIDRYGRTVAVVTCGGVEVNRAQIERGMAWVYPKYNKDLMLPGLEAMARNEGRGLWSDAEPMPPWQFRRPKIKTVNAASSKASVEGICFVSVIMRPDGPIFTQIDGKRTDSFWSGSTVTCWSAVLGSLILFRMVRR